MAKYKYEKEFLLSSHSTGEVRVFLSDHSLDLATILDAHFNTVFHIAAFNNNFPLISVYLAHQSTLSTFIPLSTLLNQTNDEGYTPLLYAAFKGNTQIMGVLIQHGACIHAHSLKGWTVYHLAAQGNQLQTFLYLHSITRTKTQISHTQQQLHSQKQQQPQNQEQTQEIPLNDVQGSTALHWAVYAGSIKIVQYILACISRPNNNMIPMGRLNIDSKDSSGNTALHIATSYGHLSIAKLLLICGANKHLKNNKNETPLDISRTLSFVNLQTILRENHSLYQNLLLYCNARQKYSPKSPSMLLPAIWLGYYLLIGYILIILLRPFSVLAYIMQSGVFAVLLVLYMSLLVPLDAGKGDEQLCLFCRKWRGERDHHCYVCGSCTARYDHHCFWINNCVGRHNILRFYLFLLLDLAYLLYSAFVATLLLYNQLTQEDIFCVVGNAALTSLQIYFIIPILLLPALLYVLPLLLLIIVQTNNLFLARTTFQRFGKRRRIDQHFSFHNCYRMLTQTEAQKELSETNSTRSKRLLFIQQS